MKGIQQKGRSLGTDFQSLMKFTLATYLKGILSTTEQNNEIYSRMSWLWMSFNPWRRKWQPTPVFLPGKSDGRRSLVGYSPWGRKESDMTDFTSYFLSLILNFAIVHKMFRIDKSHDRIRECLSETINFRHMIQYDSAMWFNL